MNAAVSSLPQVAMSSLHRGRDILHIVSIYEGLTNAIAVREAHEWLSHHVGSLLCLEHKVWNFGALKSLDSWTAALRDASDADLLIVAADCEKILPDAVQIWLESCLSPGERSIVSLVSLHDDFEGGEHWLTEHLRAIAERWHTDFVTNADFENRLNGRDLSVIARRHTEKSHCA